MAREMEENWRTVSRSAVSLTVVKSFHTIAWFSIETSMVYLLYTGFTKRADRSVALAGSIVAGETLLFTANGFRCPLTQLARSLGDEHGGVTDIYLPEPVARNLPAMHVPMLILAVYLHRADLTRLPRGFGRAASAVGATVSRARRFLYRGKRPHRLARLTNAAQAQLAARGIGPDRIVALEVVGRRTGRRLTFPLVVAEYDGERYLVSMFGQTANWVRNVRAANGEAVLRHRGRQVVRLEEVPTAERAPVLRRYLESAPGARPHIPVAPDAPVADFDRIAADYPVFRITAPTGHGRAR